MLRGSKGKGTEETSQEIREVLKDTNPGRIWFITVFTNSSLLTFDFSVKCKDGDGDTAEWLSKTEYPYNMHFYTLRTSDYNSYIDATDEDRAKAERASKSALLDMESTWREILGLGGMTRQEVRDEVIARLDRNGAKWMYVRVKAGDRIWADYCNLSRIVYTNSVVHYICNCLGD